MATASLTSCCTKGFLRNLASSVQVALLVLTVILPSAGFAQTPLENPRPKRTFQAVRGTQVQGTSRPVANQPSQTVPSQQELPPLTQAQQELIGAARTDADRLLASTWDSFNRQQLQLRELTSNAEAAFEIQTTAASLLNDRAALASAHEMRVARYNNLVGRLAGFEQPNAEGWKADVAQAQMLLVNAQRDQALAAGDLDSAASLADDARQLAIRQFQMRLEDYGRGTASLEQLVDAAQYLGGPAGDTISLADARKQSGSQELQEVLLAYRELMGRLVETAENLAAGRGGVGANGFMKVLPNETFTPLDTLAPTGTGLAAPNYDNIVGQDELAARQTTRLTPLGFVDVVLPMTITTEDTVKSVAREDDVYAAQASYAQATGLLAQAAGQSELAATAFQAADNAARRALEARLEYYGEGTASLGDVARAWNLEYRSSESLRSADYDVSDEQINQRREDFAVVASLLEDGIDLRGRGAADAAYVISLGHLEQLATLQFERKQMVSAASTSGSNSNSPPPELIRGGGNARVLEFKQPTPPSAPQP